MKTFWNTYPNLTFLAICCLCALFSFWFVDNLDNRQWGWAALNMFCLIDSTRNARKWYDRT